MNKEMQIRTIAEAVIRRVLLERPGSSRELEAAVEEAYPFGERHGHAWEIWREETRRLLENRTRAGAAA